MVEEGCGLGILSEPYSVREDPKCAGSIDGTVAIIWRDAAGSPPLQKLRKGKNYVAVTWGPIVGGHGPSQSLEGKRWALRKMDADAFMASINCALLTKESTEDEGMDEKLGWTMGILEEACNASMPRSNFRPPKKAYWWTEEIAELRKNLIRVKRRVEKKRRDEGHEDRWEEYKSLRDELRKEIRKARAGSWGELLSSLDKDPWERPYRMVLNKLKQGVSPITESLDPAFVRKIIDTLFPVIDDGLDNPREGSGVERGRDGCLEREAKGRRQENKERQSAGT
ncbi:reverse transcriptase [Lasius niger]|uniref:Reverse transcriptase n=1 Tax=Lasius niger TaxID=67767 RepID=A0A0J7K5E6_LASNI|nr:reverse transcriptase [Lasius niger]